MTGRIPAIGLLGLGLVASVIRAQVPADSARCRTALSAPAADSQVSRVVILISPFDANDHMTTAYAGLLATGIRQFLKLPQPLVLGTYDARTAIVNGGHSEGSFATLALRSAYRATLHADGLLSDVRAVGGTRDGAFDAAMMQALQELGNSHMLPDARPPAVTFSGNSIDIRILVTVDHVAPTTSSTNARLAEGVNPLFSLRLPLRRITTDAQPKRGNPAAVYPEELRALHVEGSAFLEFVVSDRGEPRPGTVQILTMTDRRFAAAALDVLPRLRFDPLILEGCPVPSLVQMPFEFHLR